MAKHLISVFTKPWTEPLPAMADKVAALGLDGIELPVRPGYQVTPENAAAGLRDASRVLNANGQVSRSGYFFTMFLPDDTGAPVQEPQAGFGLGMVNEDLAETTWCAYAWPVNYNQSGNRTFFTNQAGDVVATEDPTYSGTTAPLNGDAAFVNSGVITGSVAIAGVGADGNTWKQVN